MVTYNQWSYITLFVTLQAMLTTLDGEYKLTDFLLLVKSREEQASWQENGSLTVYLQMVVKRPGFCFRYHGSNIKTNRAQSLWLVNT